MAWELLDETPVTLPSQVDDQTDLDSADQYSLIDAALIIGDKQWFEGLYLNISVNKVAGW